MMVSSGHSILDGHEREDVEDWEDVRSFHLVRLCCALNGRHPDRRERASDVPSSEGRCPIADAARGSVKRLVVSVDASA
jgi:hypothetical protein